MVTPDKCDLLASIALDLPSAAEDLADDPARAPRWPAALCELYDVLFDELQRADQITLEPLTARRITWRLIARITSEYGGTAFSLPKNVAIRRALRDALIWAERQGGASVQSLAERSGLTRQQIHRILADQDAMRDRVGAVAD